MSIIHDALKKTQQSLEKKDKAAASVKISWLDKWSKYVLLTLLLGIVLLIVIPQFRVYLPALSEVIKNHQKAIQPAPIAADTKTPPPAPTVETKAVTSPPPSQTPVTSTAPAIPALSAAATPVPIVRVPVPPPSPLTASIPEFVIGGIMAKGNSNVALINDKIYQEGDDINGEKIMTISLDKIVLLHDGKEEVIRVGK